LQQRLRGASPTSPELGKGPLWQKVERRTSGRVLLVGDAAGYVDALTGEGLALGFRCADAALDAVAANDVARYEREWLRITRRYRLLTGGLVQATRIKQVRSALVPSAQKASSAFSFIVNHLG